MLRRDNFSVLLIFGELVLEFNIHFLNKHIENGNRLKKERGPRMKDVKGQVRKQGQS